MKTSSCITLLAFGILLVAVQASGQTNLGPKGLGVELGLVGPDNIDTTLGIGAFLDLGTFAPNMALESYLGYWANTENYAGGEEYARDLSIGVRGKYMFATASPLFHPFAGVGLGLHFVRWEVDVPDMIVGSILVPGFHNEDTDTSIGVDIGGGLQTNLSDRADLIGEIWYTAVDRYDNVSLKVGALYKFN